MEELTRLSVDDFLDHVAGRTPTPGGGSVSALAGALACALGRMAVAFSIGKKTDSATADRLVKLTQQLYRAEQLLRALITQDAAAYEHLTETARCHRGASGGSATARTAYHDAILSAAAVPMETAAVASDVLAAMDEFKALVGRNLLSDLGIGAVLADATVQSARYTVCVNARQLEDVTERSKVLADITAVVTHSARHRESIEAFVRQHLENNTAANR